MALSGLPIQAGWFGLLTHLERKEQNPPPCQTGHQRPEHHLKHYLFTLGRIPAQQHSISRDATEKFFGSELFVLSFAGERERSTRPAIPALTTGHARAVFRHFKFRDYSLGNQILSTPLLYFLYLADMLKSLSGASRQFRSRPTSTASCGGGARLSRLTVTRCMWRRFGR